MALFFHQLDFFDIAVENIGNNSYYIEKNIEEVWNETIFLFTLQQKPNHYEGILR